MTTTHDLYAIDLRALGIKDKELARLIGEVERLSKRRAHYTVQAEEATRALATLPDTLRDEGAAALAAGDEPDGEAERITKAEQAVTIAETRVAAATAALRDAERAVEAHMAEVGGTHRATVRDTAARQRQAAMEAVDEAAGQVTALTTALAAVMQLQPVPTHGLMGRSPTQQRRYLGREYDQHRVHTLLAELRDEIAGLVPPSEEAFHEAAQDKGYLHRPPAPERTELYVTDLA